MDKMYYFLVICFSFASVLSCSKEDKLTPSRDEVNYFSVPADATDEVSVLRREFYEKTGVHLLFNDTLRHEQRGTYEDGTPIWYTETIDFNYNISSSGAGTYFFDYLSDQDSREVAVGIVEEHILPHLGEGWRPYSFLLLNKIETLNILGRRVETDCISCVRSMAIGIGKAISMSSEEQADFSKSILFTLVNDKVEDLDASLFDEFYLPCQQYYVQDYTEFGLSEEPADEELYELGFVYKSLWYFPDERTDRKYFVQYAVELSEEEFREKYGNYPIVMQKYEIIREIISDMGYIF